MFILQGNLKLEIKGDLLIARSKNTVQWFGFLMFAGTLPAAIQMFVERGAGCRVLLSPLEPKLGCPAAPLLAILLFAFVGFLMMAPHKITTIFNLTADRVLQDRNLLAGLYRRCYVYSFSQVRGIRLVEYRWFTYLPFVELIDGKRLPLCCLNANYELYHPEVVKICDLTKLRELDSGGV